jgi:hypothetical protein
LKSDIRSPVANDASQDRQRFIGEALLTRLAPIRREVKQTATGCNGGSIPALQIRRLEVSDAARPCAWTGGDGSTHCGERERKRAPAYNALGFVEYGLEKRVLKQDGRYYDDVLMVGFLDGD